MIESRRVTYITQILEFLMRGGKERREGREGMKKEREGRRVGKKKKEC